MDNQSINIIPEYEIIKKEILGYYFLCIEYLTEYNSNPTPLNEKTIRKQVSKLCYFCSLKAHKVLKDENQTKLLNNYVSHPWTFTKFDIHSIFSICQLVLELSGLTEIEQTSLSKKEAYKEVE